MKTKLSTDKYISCNLCLSRKHPIIEAKGKGQLVISICKFCLDKINKAFEEAK